jgi:hypothetical protein
MSIRFGSVGRIFSGDKVVDSYPLNILGAQVLRTIAARLLYNSFSASYHAVPASLSDITQEKVAELQREGIVTWPDFLPRDEFERVRRECFNLIRNHSQVGVHSWGANTIENLGLREVNTDAMLSIQRLTIDPRLEGILGAAEKRPLGPLFDVAEVEHLTQGLAKDLEDPQSQVHSDTFFACHKAWFYVSDVSMEDGPLLYIKGSHKVTARRLFYIYKESCTRKPDADPSRRVTSKELAKMRERKEIFTCASNTLVIANVCGYHGRLQGEAGRERWAVHLSLRTNPFRVHLKRLLGLRQTVTYNPTSR